MGLLQVNYIYIFYLGYDNSDRTRVIYVRTYIAGSMEGRSLLTVNGKDLRSGSRLPTAVSGGDELDIDYREPRRSPSPDPNDPPPALHGKIIVHASNFYDNKSSVYYSNNNNLN